MRSKIMKERYDYLDSLIGIVETRKEAVQMTADKFHINPSTARNMMYDYPYCKCFKVLVKHTHSKKSKILKYINEHGKEYVYAKDLCEFISREFDTAPTLVYKYIKESGIDLIKMNTGGKARVSKNNEADRLQERRKEIDVLDNEYSKILIEADLSRPKMFIDDSAYLKSSREINNDYH